MTTISSKSFEEPFITPLESDSFIPIDANVKIDYAVDPPRLSHDSPNPWTYSNYYYVPEDNYSEIFIVTSSGEGGAEINGKHISVHSGQTGSLKVIFAKAGWYLMQCYNKKDPCTSIRYYNISPENFVGLEDGNIPPALPDKEPSPCQEGTTGASKATIGGIP